MALLACLPAVAQDDWRSARERLVREELTTSGLRNTRVLDALATIPRHEFVPTKLRGSAYFDMALAIGYDQTISSPLIVGIMTEALDPQPADRVLEIGTGSGYQAAILSPLVREVYTIEIVPALGRRAERTLRELGYDNVHVRIGDGYLGWPEQAPFDKIIVTCSPEKVPEPLKDQLREGGTMIVPVGERYQQTLYRLLKRDGQLVQEALQPTLFVPMTGKAEQERQIQPDPSRPRIVNGSFETPPRDGTELTGWYYLRQAERVASEDAPDGSFVARFRNEVPGRSSHALQGLGLDGRSIGSVTLSADIKLADVVAGPDRSMRPNIAVTFYDRSRREVGERWLGPWTGNRPWHAVSYQFKIPEATREAIVRVGLFGATGELCVDHLVLEPQPR